VIIKNHFRYSGNVLRIGHVSGVFTDIGVHIGRHMMGMKENTWRIYILLALVSSFWTGAFIAKKMDPLLGKDQLIVSALLSVGIGTAYVCYLRLNSIVVPPTAEVMNLVSPTALEYEQTDDEDYDVNESEARQLRISGSSLTDPLLSLHEGVVVEPSSLVVADNPPCPPPPLHQRDPVEFSLILSGSLAFALNAGMINGITFSSSRRFFVTNMTGYLTTFSLRCAEGNFGEMSVSVCFIAFFTTGAFLVGLMVPSSVFRLGKFVALLETHDCLSDDLRIRYIIWSGNSLGCIRISFCLCGASLVSIISILLLFCRHGVRCPECSHYQI
jgi:uncharacterized membrane protein YoaK (UPF0700 family)